MAKAPIPGRVKTRLSPPLTPEQAAELAGALLRDTVAAARRLPDVQVVVAVEPAEAVPVVRGLVPSVELVPQAVGDLGARLTAVAAARFAAGASAVLVVGSDHPTLPAAVVAQAVTWLREGRDEMVIGPAEDGGYYLLGMTRPHPEVFDEISWSTPDVLRATLDRAAALGLPVRRLPSWYDVDTPDDLARLQRALSHHPEAAPTTARWLRLVQNAVY